jgi:hypothetical protein
MKNFPPLAQKLNGLEPMVEDARFEDASPGALRLQAMDADDLRVISALIQDAVFPAAEMKWQPAQRRFGLLLNRFRWEDGAANTAKPRAERVQSLLIVDSVLSVTSSGIVRGDNDMVLSVLAAEFTPGDDGAGTLTLTLAGDGAIALTVECLDISLKDVTKPYLAVSRKVPKHDLGEA